MIDQLIDDLYELLISGKSGFAIVSRMPLHPDPKRLAYFTPAPRPVLTKTDMDFISLNGAFAGVEQLLEDVPPAIRAEALLKMRAIHDALTLEPATDGQTDPPALIYAMH